jgi:23S rRNA pseudouridine2604 synthase
MAAVLLVTTVNVAAASRSAMSAVPADRDEGGERRFGGGDRGFRPYGESRDGDRGGERREFRPVTTAVMTVLKAAVTLVTVHVRPVLAVPTRAALSAPKAASVVNSVLVTTAVMTVRKAAVTLATVHVRPVLAVLTRAVLSAPKVASAVNSVHATANVVAVIALKAAAMSVLRVVTLVTVRKTVVLVAQTAPKVANAANTSPVMASAVVAIARKAATLVIVRRTVATVTVPKAAPLIVTTVATSAVANDAATSVVASLKSAISPARLCRRPTRRPTTGIRTYRPAADGSDRAIPVKRAPEAEARQDDRPGAVRINKRIADMGLCSRREADEWVENGWVTVNGEVATMGQNVVPGDRIEIDQKAQDRQDQQVTILLNKPMGYVSGQAEDGHEPAVVLITNENRWNEDRSKTRFNFSQLKGLAPCGRLDIDSVGLLVLTQDGRVARQIIGEDSEVDKEYLVRVTFGDRDVDVQSVFPEEKLALLRHGLSLDEQPLKPAQVDWQNPEQLRFVLTEGKKRQIRRMCEQVGLKVVGLKRIRIGGVTLGNLPTGQWRYLAAHESF